MDVDQFFQNSCYNINRILLSLTGLWPFQTKVMRYMIYFVLILVIGSGFFFQLMGVIEVRQDPLELIDALPLFLFATVLLIKMFYAVYTLPKVKLLLIKMQEYCVSSKSKEECKILNWHAMIGRNLGHSYTYIVMSHSALFDVVTLVTRFMRTESEKNNTSSDKMITAQIGVPFRVNYMIDYDTYYAPIFLHSIICCTFYVFLSVVFDVLYLTFVEHCRGLFLAVRYCFENSFSENDNNGSSKKSTSDTSYSNLVYSIRKHTETIQFLNLMNSVYNMPLFLHIGGMMTGLGVVGYQVIMNAGNVDRLLKHASFLNGLVLNVFFESWLGQKIIDSSESVFESVYNAKWYKMPIRARKLIVLIMMRSMEPMVLKAGKFIILSLVTFNTVMRTSSSYYMLLQSTTQ